MRISCPVLVVRAGEGIISDAHAQAIIEQARDVRLVDLVGAKHDLQLDRPDEWRQAVTESLDGLDAPPSAPR